MGEVDLINRDPNNLNEHVKCCFEDVLGETDGVHSIDCVWKLTHSCFEMWKKICYIIHTTLCGICIGMYWGCEFAAIAFSHVWCITPFMKVIELNCSIFRRIYSLIIDCAVGPLCETCGLCFSRMKMEKC